MKDDVVCSTCGKTHSVSESELTFRLPDEVFALSEQEREARCRINADIVVLDDSRFFIRGLVPLRVNGREQKYNLGVWAEVSEDVFGRVYELWSDPLQDQEPKLPAKLSNQLPFHIDTVGLTVAMQLTGPNSRPDFFVEPGEHSLFAEQSLGIDEHRAIEYSDPVARKAAVEQTLAGGA